jgi:hypothetical protein
MRSFLWLMASMRPFRPAYGREKLRARLGWAIRIGMSAVMGDAAVLRSSSSRAMAAGL